MLHLLSYLLCNAVLIDTAILPNFLVGVSSPMPDRAKMNAMLSVCRLKLLQMQVLEDSKSVKKERWVRDNQGQMVITAGQIVWTAECEAAVADADSARKKLSTLKKKWISYLDKLTDVTQSQLTAIEHNKVRHCHLAIMVVCPRQPSGPNSLRCLCSDHSGNRIPVI